MATARAERLDYLQTPPQQDGRKPLWHESLVGLEIWNHLTSTVLLKESIPRGDGSAVIVVPGFWSNDSHTESLRNRLRRANYDSRSSGIKVANLNPESYEDRLVGEIDEAFAETHQKVHLLGHSLGGIVVRAIAARRAEKVKTVTTLGSPLFGEPEDIITPAVLKAAEFWIPIIRDRNRLEKRKQEISQSLSHMGVRVTSIYTKRDGIVDWRYCKDPNPENDNIEVTGSHMALIYNRDVDRHLGVILSLPQMGEIIEHPVFSRPAA